MSEHSLTKYEPLWPETALIWGSGASKQLGLPTTDDIGRIISVLAGVAPEGGLENALLEKRFKRAFKGLRVHSELEKAFKDLLLLLFDGDGAESPLDALRQHKKHVKKMSQEYASEFGLSRDDRENVEHYFSQLHVVYDWIGVRSIVKYIARRWDEDKKRRGEIVYTDLLTTVDQLYESNLAIPTGELFHPKNQRPDSIYLIDKHRLLGVKRCLTHLTATIQRIIIQKKPGRFSQKRLRPYWTIARTMGELMKEESEAFHRWRYRTDERRFYYYSYAFISYNWDPVMAWLIFKAHKEINDSRLRLGGSTLRLFNDSGDGIGIRKIMDKYDTDDEDLLAFMMNESTCKRINDPKYQGGEKSRVVRVGKMLFPHAGLAWRICPRCGKLFTDFGHTFDDPDSTVAFGPDLLPGLNRAWKLRTKDEVKHQRHGEYGVIQCIFCGSITRPYDVPLILQSAIKSERHYVLEGIFRELGLVVGNARHLVFAGYSLPKDDYIYRCFFQSAWAGKDLPRFCSLINYDPQYAKAMGSKAWLEGDDVLSYRQSQKAKPHAKETIRNLLELFDLKNIRVSLLGIPDILTNHPDKDPKEALIDLLYPRRCFSQGFPLRRPRGPREKWQYQQK